MSYTTDPDMSPADTQFNNVDPGDTDTNNAATIRHGHGVRAEKHITVQKSPHEVYEFWHNFENLPIFMQHLQSVTKTGPNTTHWVAKAPAGSKVEWDAEIINDVPDELIAWRSRAPADVPNAGTVRFRPAPTGYGTTIDVELMYDPPGGMIGAAVAKMFGEEPSQQIEDDLERFKEYIETGYAPVTGS